MDPVQEEQGKILRKSEIYSASRLARAHTRFVGPQIASCIFYNTPTRTQRTGRDRVRLGRPRPRFQELGRALLTANRLEMKETSGFQQLSLGRPANFTCPTLEMVL